MRAMRARCKTSGPLAGPLVLHRRIRFTDWSGCLDHIYIYIYLQALLENIISLSKVQAKKPLMPNFFFHHRFLPPVNFAIFGELQLKFLHSTNVNEILDSLFVCSPIYYPLDHAGCGDVVQLDSLWCENWKAI